MSTGGEQIEPPKVVRTRFWRVLQTVLNCVQLLVIGFLLEGLLFSATDVAAQWRVVAIALLLVGFIYRQAWLWLFTVMTVLFVTEIGNTRQVFLDVGDVLYAFLVIGLLAYAASAKRTATELSEWIADRIFRVMQEPAELDSAPSSRQRQRGWWGPGRTLLVSVIASICVATILAVLTIAFLPISLETRQEWFNQSLGPGREMWPGPTVISLVFVVLIVSREIAWKRLNVRQAGIVMRTTFVNYHLPDLRMTIRKRQKIAAKNSKRKAKIAENA